MSREISYVCISLPQAKARRAFMREQFARMRIPARFFDAIAVSPELAGGTPGYALAHRLHRCGYGLTPGEIGCYLSHREVWRQFLQSDQDLCCVLEDDGILLEDFRDTVEDVGAARDHWDFVRLHCLYRRGARPYCVTGGLRQLNWVPCAPISMMGYMLTRHAAATLLAHTETMIWPIDESVDRCWEHRLRQFVVHPEVIAMSTLPSDIGERPKPRMSTHVKLRCKLHRRADKMRRLCFNLSSRPRRVVRLDGMARDSDRVRSRP